MISMKMTLNKLIANDIINYGMDQTTNFNYSVYLDEYIELHHQFVLPQILKIFFYLEK